MTQTHDEYMRGKASALALAGTNWQAVDAILDDMTSQDVDYLYKEIQAYFNVIVDAEKIENCNLLPMGYRQAASEWRVTWGKTGSAKLWQCPICQSNIVIHETIRRFCVITQDSEPESFVQFPMRASSKLFIPGQDFNIDGQPFTARPVVNASAYKDLEWRLGIVEKTHIRCVNDKYQHSAEHWAEYFAEKIKNRVIQ